MAPGLQWVHAGGRAPGVPGLQITEVRARGMRRVADQERRRQAPVWIATAIAELRQARQCLERQLGRGRRRDVGGCQARHSDARGALSPVRFVVDVVDDSHVYHLPHEDGKAGAGHNVDASHTVREALVWESRGRFRELCVRRGAHRHRRRHRSLERAAHALRAAAAGRQRRSAHRAVAARLQRPPQTPAAAPRHGHRHGHPASR